MPTRSLTKPPAPRDSWAWTVELYGDADQCRYRLHRDALLLVSGSIEALDGSHHAELHDQRLGETPTDLSEMCSSWLWAIEQCREVMTGQGGQVHW